MALTEITVVFISVPPSTTSTQVIPVPASLQSLDSTVGNETGFSAFAQMLANIGKQGGIVFTNASGILTFIPLPWIISVTAQ